jgi:hypothetical protein
MNILAYKSQFKEEKERNKGRSNMIEETLRKNNITLQKTKEQWKSNLENLKNLSEQTIEQKMFTLNNGDNSNQANLNTQSSMDLFGIVSDLEHVQNRYLDETSKSNSSSIKKKETGNKKKNNSSFQAKK